MQVSRSQGGGPLACQPCTSSAGRGVLASEFERKTPKKGAAVLRPAQGAEARERPESSSLKTYTSTPTLRQRDLGPAPPSAERLGSAGRSALEHSGRHVSTGRVVRLRPNCRVIMCLMAESAKCASIKGKSHLVTTTLVLLPVSFLLPFRWAPAGRANPSSFTSPDAFSTSTCVDCFSFGA